MYLADVVFLVVLAAIFLLLAFGPIWAIRHWSVRRRTPSRVRQNMR